MKIDAIEDINAFWQHLGSRNKLYQVEIGGKIYKDMELTYSRDKNQLDRFVFEERKLKEMIRLKDDENV